MGLLATPQLGNCPKCKKLYFRVRDICDDCHKKIEEDFLKVAAFLREYPGSTLQEVSDETKVSVAQIRQFILSGRLIMGSFPNLTYPCETCGTMIRAGRTCKNCMSRINQLNNQHSTEKENSQDRKNQSGGYITNYL